MRSRRRVNVPTATSQQLPAHTSAAWIDIHAHVTGLSRSGVDATPYGVAQGVGTLVDAGSAPPAELAERLRAIAAATATTVLAWANICAEGIAGRDCSEHDISGAAARSSLESLAGRAVGIKLQASNTRHAVRALAAIENAKSIAADFGVPLLVHVGNAPPTIREVAAALRQGDIITHFAHPKPDGALEGNRVHPALLAARGRGVLFDIGHGSASFSLDVMEALAAQGFWPDTISTDLHARSAESPVGSLADCMSKLLGLGMALDGVIAAVTSRPREALHLPPETRRTRFAVVEGPWTATDSTGATRRFHQRIVPEAVHG
jgi:dihydroorotase